MHSYKNKASERASRWAKSNPERRREISRAYSRRKNGSTEETLKVSSTHKGRYWEELIAFIFGAHDMNQTKMGARYDLDLDGLKIDVKSSQLFMRKRRRGKECKQKNGVWIFNKNKNNADVFLCVCANGLDIVKLLLVPSEIFGRTGISVGEKSKFDKYAISLPSVR